MPPTVVRIDDPTDPRVDDYRELKDTARRRAGTFIAESERVIDRLLTSRFSTRSLLLNERRYERLASRLVGLDASVPAFVAADDVINALVGFPLHRGALALGVRTPDARWQDVVRAARTIVIVEDVVDPDNVGAIFRHSAAFGVDAVILSPHGGDPLYRKAIRAAVGWSLHVDWCRLAEHEWPAMLDEIGADGWTTMALTPDAKAPDLAALVATFAADQRVALVLGTEHDGLSREVMANASTLARIPMVVGVDSLNVATTVAISLYELARRSWP